jgi:hypothetical protein
MPPSRPSRRAPRARNLAGVAVAAALLVAGACSDDGDGGDDAGGAAGDGTTSTTAAPELPAGYEGYASEVYADGAHWLCKPGLTDDVCSRDLDATAVAADGTAEVIVHEADPDAPVDCFYVYPTTSHDPAINSDFTPGEAEEIGTVYNQAARLNSACRVFAPIYRQVTLSGLGGARPADGTDPRAVAYADVVDAFRHYVAEDSDGRGFVLIGHSQGAGLLNRLIAEEIDDEPLLRDRLVAAYILGSSVHVPAGEVVGGDFANVPLCERSDQTGCVVSYASFRSTSPPPPGSFFGRADETGPAACVNPADLAGGPAPLQPYFLVDPPVGTLLGGTAAVDPFADPARTGEITTPWVSYPDFVTAECVSEGEYSWLELTVRSDPADGRTDDIGGDITPEWGMHLIDANVAMGDIEALVTEQAAAYAG